jgi:hypothetical protein
MRTRHNRQARNSGHPSTRRQEFMMAKKSKAKILSVQDVLRDSGTRLPETTEGVACAGTAAEKRTLKVRNKAFLFIGQRDAMLKLTGSLAEAEEFASREPDLIKVGAHGWTTIRLNEPKKLSVDLLTRWVKESYCSFAPKSLVATLEHKSNQPR